MHGPFGEMLERLRETGAWPRPPGSCGDCQQSDVAKLARRMATRAPANGRANRPKGVLRLVHRVRIGLNQETRPWGDAHHGSARPPPARSVPRRSSRTARTPGARDRTGPGWPRQKTNRGATGKTTTTATRRDPTRRDTTVTATATATATATTTARRHANSERCHVN